MLASVAAQSKATTDALDALQEVYRSCRAANISLTDNSGQTGTEWSNRLTEARERFLRVAFNEAFGPLAQELHVALAAAGGTANRTTARFSDIDIVVISRDDLSTKDSFKDALNRFRDTLQSSGVHFDLQYSPVEAPFDCSSFAKITNPKRKEMLELKLAETHLSLLAARRIAGSEDAFADFSRHFRDDLQIKAFDLLVLWHKSVQTRWETFTEATDSARFDIKGSIGALRECDTLIALKFLTQTAKLPDHLITDQEVEHVRKLQEPLLKLKHCLHLLSSEELAPPNPEDRKFTACTLQKLYQMLPDPAQREEALFLIAQTRSELELIAARVHRRVADYINNVKQPSDPELDEEPFTRAYAALKQESARPDRDIQRTVAAVTDLFATWREKLGPIDPRRTLRSLSTLEHQVLSDVISLGLSFDSDRIPLNPPATRAIRSIFEAPGPRAPILELMYWSGWLHRLIPEIDAAQKKNTGKLEEPVSHLRHGLETVRILDSLLGHSFPLERDHPFAGISRLYIEKPETLYLATLFHDFGYLPSDRRDSDKKGHEERGAGLSYHIARSLGYSEYDAYRVHWLVKHHHKLRTVSRKASLNDDVLGRRVMDAVHFPNILSMLYPLTAADALATPRRRDDALSHAWLAKAFQAGMTAMNPDGLMPDQEALKRRIAQAFAKISNKPEAEALAAVGAHLADLPPAYGNEISADEILHHLIGSLQEKHPYIHWINEGEIEADVIHGSRPQRVVIVAPDRPGLLSRMCGGIPNFPIKEARVFTTHSGLACNVITCAVPRSMNSSDLVRHTSKLESALTVKPPPSRTLIQSYRDILAAKKQSPEAVSYEIEQQITDAGAEISINGPDRKHLASIVASLFPGVITAKFAQGSTPGTVFDSFVLPHALPKEKLQTIATKLNEYAGILPPEDSI